jgi:hypothetical protein
MGDSMIARVTRHCHKERGNAKKLAAKMGYKTVQTIYAWMKNKAIPKRAMAQLNKISFK